MIIGGGSVYQACLADADKLYLTFIDAEIDGDTQFPDWGEGWQQTHSEYFYKDKNNAYDMQFVVLDKWQ